MKKTILFVGDSVVSSFPFKQNLSWTYWVSLFYTEYTIKNMAVPGSTYADIITQIERYQLMSSNPIDTLFMMSGINDTFSDISLGEIKVHCDNILEYTSKLEANLLVGLNIALSNSFSIYQQQKYYAIKDSIQNWANNKNQEIMNMNILIPDSKDYYDEIHPSENGYKKIAEYFIENWRK